MQYVIADIHGCYDEFVELLKKINFNDDDTLYVLGDVVDRGPDPMKILFLMASFPNIIPIVGNHEHTMLKLLPKLMLEIEYENFMKVLTPGFMSAYAKWAEHGAKTTIETFRKLSEEDREFILDYIKDFSLYEETVANGKEFFLSHTLPDNFHLDPYANYAPEQLLYERPDFFWDWNTEKTYIVGHTPTANISKFYSGTIYQRGNLIDIDCGCSMGYTLAAYCLETGEVTYVDAKAPDDIDEEETE